MADPLVKRRLGIIALLVVAGFGAATTLFWLTLSGDTLAIATNRFRPLSLSLLVLALLTTINLLIRWVRWHFLLRRFQLNVRTKDSLKLWLITVPAIATPFYTGELLRPVLLAKRYPKALWGVTGIWLIERLTDLAVLGFFVVIVLGRWQILLISLAIGAVTISILLVRFRNHVIGTLVNPYVTGVILSLTFVAWLLPVLGLWGLLNTLGMPISIQHSAEAFSLGTLLGGFTGIPLGIGVTGSLFIVLLQSKGIDLQLATIAIAVFRAGTVWYAIGIGVFAFVLWKGTIFQLLRGSHRKDHFDAISEGYEQNIPQHVQDRLIVRKIEAMQYWLEPLGAREGWRGLDVGCGQGWYASEMAKRGYHMSACDTSLGQVLSAQSYVHQKGVAVNLHAADARSLPFADSTFDFAFSINVIHHITPYKTRIEAIQEIIRILKPGGIFLLQEINTANPIFSLYLGYLFPLLRDIDEGTEAWVLPTALPTIEGASWDSNILYFNFLPDFTPQFLLDALESVEQFIERSRFRHWGSHFVACLLKDGARSKTAATEHLSKVP